MLSARRTRIGWSGRCPHDREALASWCHEIAKARPHPSAPGILGRPGGCARGRAPAGQRRDVAPAVERGVCNLGSLPGLRDRWSDDHRPSARQPHRLAVLGHRLHHQLERLGQQAGVGGPCRQAGPGGCIGAAAQAWDHGLAGTLLGLLPFLVLLFPPVGTWLEDEAVPARVIDELMGHAPSRASAFAVDAASPMGAATGTPRLRWRLGSSRRWRVVSARRSRWPNEPAGQVADGTETGRRPLSGPGEVDPLTSELVGKTKPPERRARALPSPYRARAGSSPGVRRERSVACGSTGRQRGCPQHLWTTWGQGGGSVDEGCPSCGQQLIGWGRRWGWSGTGY
jgi:hypothetical protein